MDYQNKMTNLALMLEKYLIPKDEWDNYDVPDILKKLTRNEIKNGYPAGISYHPDYGWFGIEAGQGPFVWRYEMSRNEFDQLLKEYNE